MPFRFVDEISTADVAFEAWGATLEELFISAAAALLATMTAAPEQVKFFINPDLPGHNFPLTA